MDSRRRRGAPVDCIACGRRVPRVDAREYDAYGDRWDRSDKVFEYLCKPCHDAECHLPRDGLEAALATIGTRSGDAPAFIAAYYAEVRANHDRRSA